MNVCSYLLTENRNFSEAKLLDIKILFSSLLKRNTGIFAKAGIEHNFIFTENMELYRDNDIETLTVGNDVSFARDFLCGFDKIVVTHLDMPLIDESVLKEALENHKNGSITVLTTYDRIIKSDTEGSVFILDGKTFAKFLNANSDIYDFAKGFSNLTFIEADVALCARISDRISLIEIKDAARQKTLYSLCEKGVEFEAFDGILIDENAVIEEGAIILPGTIIEGYSLIKKGAEIGPNSRVINSVIGENTVFKASFIENSSIGGNSTVGPFSNIRPGCSIAENVKIGDFVEVKNSSIAEKTSVAHLTYVGDSDVGSGVNFGCGTVTVNYDGKNKYRTTIGDNVFIGCNTNFIAPVKIEDNTFIAAGSTITKDVPQWAMAISRTRQENKIGYAKRFLNTDKK